MLLTGLGIRVGPSVTTGNGMDFLVGRLSYTFGLTGEQHASVLLSHSGVKYCS